MREHFIRLLDESKPKGRTLFLLNIPPYVSKDNLESVFNRIGNVVSVMFAEKAGRDETVKWKQNCTEFSSNRLPYKFKVAYVVFKSSKSVAKALNLKSIDMFNPITRESLVISGIDVSYKEHEDRILNEEAMQTKIDSYMAEYDIREKAVFDASKTTAPDDEGWITIGKKGHNAGFEQKESVINKLEDKLERGRKTKELKNFYTFQIRETKMKEIMTLKEKYEEDKKRIEAMKKSRRFKPF